MVLHCCVFHFHSRLLQRSSRGPRVYSWETAGLPSPCFRVFHLSSACLTRSALYLPLHTHRKHHAAPVCYPPPPPKKVKHCMSSFYFLLKLCLTHAETGGLRCVSTFWSEALIRSHTHLVFTDACGLKSFYFLSPVVGYSSLLTDNDVRTIDIPGTPPPMPPKKHPHEIDNSGFSTEVRLLRENLTHPLTNTYLMSCKR